MDNYTLLGGISIAPCFDKRRSLANGKFPVKIRVTHKRVRDYHPTGISLTKIEWGKLDTAKTQFLIKQKEAIHFALTHIKNIAEALVREDSFSFEQLDLRLGKGVDTTVNITYLARIEKLKIDEKHNTSDFYKYSLKAVENFAGNNISFKDITVEWLNRFEKHLFKEDKSYTTISMYMRGLQAIINEGKKAGIIKEHQFPFGMGKYQIPQHSERKIALDLQSIEKIFSYQCANDIQSYYRDLWTFIYLCNGANVVDLCNFKFENIKNDELEFYRQKTIAKSKIKKKVLAIMTPEMRQIIDRWGNKEKSPNDYIFPILKGKETEFEKRAITKRLTRSLNYYMQKIGKDLGIDKISSYTARHSFATVLKRFGVSIASIGESLGHSHFKVTENYLASFEAEERIRNSQFLTNFSTEEKI